MLASESSGAPHRIATTARQKVIEDRDTVMFLDQPAQKSCSCRVKQARAPHFAFSGPPPVGRRHALRPCAGTCCHVRRWVPPLTFWARPALVPASSPRRETRRWRSHRRRGPSQVSGIRTVRERTFSTSRFNSAPLSSDRYSLRVRCSASVGPHSPVPCGCLPGWPTASRCSASPRP